MNCFFDIETVPVQDPDMIAEIAAEMKEALDIALDAVRAPSNYKDEAKITEYVAKEHARLVAEHDGKVQDAILKTSFDGGMGQCCVIGWAFDDEAPFSYYAKDLSPATEAKLLQDWFCALTDRHTSRDPLKFIGHNIIGFDLPFIWKRAIVLGVKPPYFFPRDPKPWSDGVADTMLMWGGAKPGGSMERICRALGIPGKGGISGADVWPMVQAGRIADVATYCEDDVSRARAMYRRMTFEIAA